MQRIYYRFADFLSQKLRTDVRFFASGGFWLTALQATTLAGGLVTTIAYTHFLDPSSYGTYKYLISLGVLLTTFSFTGIGQSIQQTIIKGYFGFFPFAMRKSFLFSAGIALSALVIGGYYFSRGDTILAIGCAITAVLIPLTTVYQNVMYLLLGLRRFKTITIFQGFDTLITTFILVGVLFITRNLLILLAVYLALQFLGNLIAHLMYKPQDPEVIPAEITKKYYAYAWNTTIRNSLFNVAFRLDNIVVFSHLGATDLAIYSIANLIPEQIKGSFKNLSSLLLVRYARHDDLDTVRRSIFKRSTQLLFVLLAIAVLYVLLAPFLYHLLFPKYDSAIFYTQIAALSFPAYIALIPTSALQAQLKEKELHFINLFNSLCLLGAVIFLTYTFGLIGALVARILYRYANLLLSYYFVLRKQS